ncbi:MAG: HemK family protein methyltransferase, partial [Patescibacteria group bacterium]
MLFTVQNLLKLGAKSLNKASNSKDLDAEILLSHILKINRATMLAQTNKTISYLTAGRFWWLIFKRRHHIPIAYLTGRQEFYGHSFLVNKNVLIPRPETELLIEIAMSTIRANSALTTAIDIGTGSGCIAITLALE